MDFLRFKGGQRRHDASVACTDPLTVSSRALPVLAAARRDRALVLHGQDKLRRVTSRTVS